ncbi:hypothetical protein GOB93_12565 [Acetobacter musti]|uniref:Transposase n=1 Tax=Acetobacter musti TaxID=864732 RepID=A0ABX0JQR2_9PROT|nr:hypothetical protein [Acetobacter musti]NHN85469.1 hypothetical protein [Acetobacter musti]
MATARLAGKRKPKVMLTVTMAGFRASSPGVERRIIRRPGGRQQVLLHAVAYSILCAGDRRETGISLPVQRA